MTIRIGNLVRWADSRRTAHRLGVVVRHIQHRPYPGSPVVRWLGTDGPVTQATLEQGLEEGAGSVVMEDQLDDLGDGFCSYCDRLLDKTEWTSWDPPDGYVFGLWPDGPEHQGCWARLGPDHPQVAACRLCTEEASREQEDDTIRDLLQASIATPEPYTILLCLLALHGMGTMERLTVACDDLQALTQKQARQRALAALAAAADFLEDEARESAAWLEDAPDHHGSQVLDSLALERLGLLRADAQLLEADRELDAAIQARARNRAILGEE